MLRRVVRWAREGTIATVTAVAVLGAPAHAFAGDGWWDSAKATVKGLGALLSPTHPVGRFSSGAVLALGVAPVTAVAGEMAVAAGAAAAIGTAATVGAIAIAVVGVGLLAWGGYELWRNFREDHTRPDLIEPPRPGGPGAGPGRPDRVDPGAPGTPSTPSGPGTVNPGGGSTAPGSNPGRGEITVPGRDLPRNRRPNTGAGGAQPAGIPR